MVIEVGDVIRLGNQNVRVFLLVFYMPVRVVGEPVELQRQFIMIVAFRVVVCRGVFTSMNRYTIGPVPTRSALTER